MHWNKKKKYHITFFNAKNKLILLFAMEMVLENSRTQKMLKVRYNSHHHQKGYYFG